MPEGKNYDEGITHVIITKTDIANENINMCQEKQLDFTSHISATSDLYMLAFPANIKSANIRKNHHDKDHQTYKTHLLFDDNSLVSKLSTANNNSFMRAKFIFPSRKTTLTISLERYCDLYYSYSRRANFFFF